MQKITSQRLYNQVLEGIKDMIRSGELKYGDFLPSENALAKTMGVSRVTVRRALKELSEVGIIQTEKGKGSIVALDWKNLLEPGDLRNQSEQYQRIFFDSTKARRVIEPAVAKMVAACATQEDILNMEAALSQADEPATLSSAASRKDFHTCMWEALHNPVMMQIWLKLLETSVMLNQLPMVPPLHREFQKEETYRQHRNILDAICRHDEEYAYFYMLQHCDWIESSYRQYFENFLK